MVDSIDDGNNGGRSMDDDGVDGNGANNRLVLAVLSHIRDLAMQLETNLRRGSSHDDLCRHLTSMIFSSTERSIGIITSSSNLGSGRKRSAADAGLRSDVVADVPFVASRKRKGTERRKHQVRVSPGGDGTPVDDGHSWRKYGQKEILGATYPRGYYRCTHRHSRGCAATKQVQRNDEDPTLFDVVHLGMHTCGGCTQTSAVGQATQPPAEHNSEEAPSLLPSRSAEPQGTNTPFSVSSTPVSPFWPPSSTSTSEDRGLPVATTTETKEAVVTPLVAPTTPSDPGVDIIFNELSDFDISSFFA